MIYKYPHHQESIERFIELIKEKPEFLAVVLSGSISRGEERENSDIDVYLVVTEEEFARRSQNQELSYFNHKVCTYEGGYIDGKIITYDFLKKAAEYGSEPTRTSFFGGITVWSKVPGLEEVVKRIPEFEEEIRESKLRSFYAQILVWGNYMAKEGIKKDNPFLTQRSVNELILFSARYILCYNRILFPGFKPMMKAVMGCNKIPEGFVEKTEKLLLSADWKDIKRYVKMMLEFADEGTVSFEQAVGIFVQESESNWLDGKPSVEDW